jgi:hypothetical protein
VLEDRLRQRQSGAILRVRELNDRERRGGDQPEDQPLAGEGTKRQQG